MAILQLQIILIASILILTRGFMIQSSLSKSVRNMKLLQSSSSDILADENKLSSLNIAIKKISDQITELNKVDKIWQVDADSGDLECGSSSDNEMKNKIVKLVSEKEILEKEAVNIKAAIEEKKLKLSTKSFFEIETPTIVTPAKVDATSTTANTNSNKNAFQSLTASTNTGFDMGLLIAFPLMVGSLLFFLFFPIIGESLSSSTVVP
jgi:hypothetical protein